MRLQVAVLTAAAVTLVAGCADPESAEWVPAKAQATPTAASSTAPARLARVTSACKVLTADAVIDILGGTSTTKLKAREDGVEDLGDGAKRYTCGYGRDGNEPFALSVTERPDPNGTAVASIDQIADWADGEARRISGLTYVKGRFRGTAVAVPYRKNLRIAVFMAPRLVPREKLIEVAEHLVTRL
jgi:hypothetical protein